MNTWDLTNHAITVCTMIEPRKKFNMFKALGSCFGVEERFKNALLLKLDTKLKLYSV